MKLNPAKCEFGVSQGKFIGFMISQRGIEASLEKVKAILDMASPRIVRQVHRLTGQIAALNRFVSKAKDKCLPFFKTLKKVFQWTDKCEDLFLYLAVSQIVISLALIHKESKIQQSVYYTSQSFQGAKMKYPRMGKLAFALVIASRKLHPYSSSCHL